MTGQDTYELYRELVGGVASPSLTGLKKPALPPWDALPPGHQEAWKVLAGGGEIVVDDVDEFDDFDLSDFSEPKPEAYEVE